VAQDDLISDMLFFHGRESEFRIPGIVFGQ